MQSIELGTGLTDRVQRTMEATGNCFEQLPTSQNPVMWKHSGIPNMVLCVEQDGDVHDVLLVGEEIDPDNLYPFDDVCSCWAGEWQGSLPTVDMRKKDVATNRLPSMIDQCIGDSIKCATKPSEPEESDDPPDPVLSPAESLALVNEHADEIKELFSVGRIVGTRTRLRERRQRIYTRMGLDFGHASERQEVPLGLAAQSVDIK